jgi:hypothetical protein
MEERWKVGQGWLRDCGGDCCADARSIHFVWGGSIMRHQSASLQRREGNRQLHDHGIAKMERDACALFSLIQYLHSKAMKVVDFGEKKL